MSRRSVAAARSPITKNRRLKNGSLRLGSNANDPPSRTEAAKLRFIIRWTIFFLVYILTAAGAGGFFPALMKTQVLGKVNWALPYALSQFL